MAGWARLTADAGACESPFGVSWLPVLNTWYPPRSREAVVSMKDCVKLVITLSQPAVQPMPGAGGLARKAWTRAATPRLNWRNAAGVLKFVNPGPGSKPKPVAAWSSVRAESSRPRTNLYAESLDTNGASG